MFGKACGEGGREGRSISPPHNLLELIRQHHHSELHWGVWLKMYDYDNRCLKLSGLGSAVSLRLLDLVALMHHFTGFIFLFMHASPPQNTLCLLSLMSANRRPVG